MTASRQWQWQGSQTPPACQPSLPRRQAGTVHGGYCAALRVARFEFPRPRGQAQPRPQPRRSCQPHWRAWLEGQPACWPAQLRRALNAPGVIAPLPPRGRPSRQFPARTAASRPRALLPPPPAPPPALRPPPSPPPPLSLGTPPPPRWATPPPHPGQGPRRSPPAAPQTRHAPQRARCRALWPSRRPPGRRSRAPPRLAPRRSRPSHRPRPLLSRQQLLPPHLPFQLLRLWLPQSLPE
mmetsp:Transcript_11399/g.44074  ORF Transcript_11399/g.44074 Transcript_11399/m.44074 type:complete len:238 (-) Transcript_11399:23-736(-)